MSFLTGVQEVFIKSDEKNDNFDTNIITAVKRTSLDSFDDVWYKMKFC